MRLCPAGFVRTAEFLIESACWIQSLYLALVSVAISCFLSILSTYLLLSYLFLTQQIYFPTSSAIESDVATDVLVGDGAVVDVGASDVSVRFVASVDSTVSV